MKYLFYILFSLVIIQQTSAMDRLDLTGTHGELSAQKDVVSTPRANGDAPDQNDLKKLLGRLETAEHRIDALDRRQVTSERLLSHMGDHAPVEFVKRIPADKILAVALLIGFFGTILYIISPELAAPIVFMSYSYTAYGSLKMVRDMATVAGNSPLTRAKGS